MRPEVVVELSPALDHGAGFAKVPEPLPVEALVSQLAIEALHEPVVPGLARRDEARAHVHVPKPLHDPGRGELGPLVGADELGFAVKAHQARERQDDVPRGDRRGNFDRQALAGVLIEDVEQPDRPLARQAVVHEVVGPDVVRAHRAKHPHIGATAPTPRPAPRQVEPHRRP